MVNDPRVSGSEFGPGTGIAEYLGDQYFSVQDRNEGKTRPKLEPQQATFTQHDVTPTPKTQQAAGPPSPPPPPSDESPNAHILDLHKKGGYSLVLELLLAIHPLPPTPSDSYAKWSTYIGKKIIEGNQFLKKNLMKDAEQAFTQAIEMDRMHASGYYERGKFYEQRKGYQAALEDYSQAVSLDAAVNSNHQCALGAMHYRLGNLQQAVKPLTKAKEEGNLLATLLLDLLQF